MSAMNKRSVAFTVWIEEDIHFVDYANRDGHSKKYCIYVFPEHRHLVMNRAMIAPAFIK